MTVLQRPSAAPALDGGKGLNGDARMLLLLLAVALAGAAVLFWDAMGNMWSRWGQQDELSHSYFIPLISAWLVWTNREAVAGSIGGPSWAGLGVGVAGLSSFILGQLTSIYLFQHLGLVVVIAGLVAGFGGLSLLRAVAAPVGFLFFAVPPPFWVISVLSWKFQDISSVLGVAMLEAMSVPVYLSGNIIDLGEYKLQVAEACSGLRYLFPFLSIGVIASYMYRGPLWYKAIIVLATVPITILMNSFRIAVTGLLVQNYGPEHAEGALHFFEGWVVFVFCLIALFGVVAALCQLSKPKQSPFEALTTPELAPVAPSAGATPAFAPPGAVIAAFAAFFALSQIVTIDSLIIPERKRLVELTRAFPDWDAEIRPIDADVAETLGADDSIVIDFARADGGVHNVYIAYLEAQRDGRSWHSPKQCIPGGGWKITRHDVIDSRTRDDRPFAYNRMIIENRGARQLVYYWYDQRGRKIANEFVMKLWLIIDAVTRKRSDGAMVRLIVPVPENKSMEAAEAELQDVLARIETVLPDYAPH